MRKLILRNFQSPGDIVMLTGAVRDLHRAHPGEFQIDVRTSCPAPESAGIAISAIILSSKTT